MKQLMYCLFVALIGVEKIGNFITTGRAFVLAGKLALALLVAGPIVFSSCSKDNSITTVNVEYHEFDEALVVGWFTNLQGDVSEVRDMLAAAQGNQTIMIGLLNTLVANDNLKIPILLFIRDEMANFDLLFQVLDGMDNNWNIRFDNLEDQIDDLRDEMTNQFSIVGTVLDDRFDLIEAYILDLEDELGDHFDAGVAAILAGQANSNQINLANHNVLIALLNSHTGYLVSIETTGENTNGMVLTVLTTVLQIEGNTSGLPAWMQSTTVQLNGFGNTLGQLLLGQDNILNGVTLNGDAIAAAEQTLMQAIVSGFANVGMSFQEVKQILITRFGNIDAVLATLATSADVNALGALIQNGFASNQTFFANAISDAQTVIVNAVNNSNQPVLAAIGNLGTALQNMLLNIANGIDDVQLAISLIDGFNNCCNGCGQSAPVIVYNTVITNVVVQQACCNFPQNPMPPMNGCD